MGKRLYVGNLPYSVRDQDLANIFSEIGKVVSAQVIIERDTGRSKGFGFVEMENDTEAAKAIQQFDGGDLDGRRVRVSEAQPVQTRSAMRLDGVGPRGYGRSSSDRW